MSVEWRGSGSFLNNVASAGRVTKSCPSDLLIGGAVANYSWKELYVFFFFFLIFKI
jgi:hypothetical protein